MSGTRLNEFKTTNMAAAFSGYNIFIPTMYDNFIESDGYPPTEEPVFILGQQYDSIHARKELDEDVQSKLWFTYRKGFTAIGGSGPTSDVGWGCMLRCGQMMLGQALVNRHLNRDWRWTSGRYDPKYFEILRLFQDKKESCFSIHQIASMGVSEGKAIGDWFGPNTIVQVLRKLAVYDTWSGMVIHVAMDNTVIIEDIYRLCKTDESTKPGSSKSIILSKYQQFESTPMKKTHLPNGPDTNNGIDGKDGKTTTQEVEQEEEFAILNRGWRPLLLVIPLRLGLSEINTTYFSAVKACFRMSQSVGMIGGKPSHAHWFIGYTESRLFYLDPHTVQPFVDLLKKDSTDESFHSKYPCHMDITELDPSLAVGFYCDSKDDFDDLCSSLNRLVKDAKAPMFEVHAKRPPHFPPLQPYCLDKISTKSSSGFTVLDNNIRQMDTDDEFEIL